jgi:hypothetical protein
METLRLATRTNRPAIVDEPIRCDMCMCVIFTYRISDDNRGDIRGNVRVDYPKHAASRSTWRDKDRGGFRNRCCRRLSVL